MGRAGGRQGRGRNLLSRLAVLLALVLAPSAHATLDDLGVGARLLAAERAALTAGERKIDARLRTARVPRRAAALVPLPETGPEARVYVRLASTAAEDVARLEALGATIEIVDAAGGRVQARVPPGRVATLAALPQVIAIRPVEPGRLRTGAVTSEGDAAARADLARGLGFDGQGTTIGIISDGIDALAATQASGDLGAVSVPAGPGCEAGSGDEGTALLEIAHDLAPGAALAFSGGATSSLGFIHAVDCLVAAGARVIADDLGFFDEPFFADGPVAAAVRAAVQAGVSFHSAAGNDNGTFVQGLYSPSPTSTLHDFLVGPGVDNGDDVVVPAGGVLTCVLQWNDPFGASANDYDLALFDESLALIAASTNPQTGTQDPLEIVAAANASAGAAIVKVAIDRAAGADRVLRLFCFGGAGMQYTSPNGSIFGHPALDEVVSVAAIDAADPGLDDVEPYSSRGPVLLFVPGPVVRDKPDLAGFDGVSITNAGGFPSCPPACRFFGTSAAVPHSAAVAALLLGKNPFLSPADVAQVLRGTAVDVESAGFDDAAGAGRLDAFAALSAVPAPECSTSAACDDGDPCTTDVCAAGRCGHPPVSCEDGEFCNGVETCDPVAGCVAGTPPSCADADPCTVDGCDSTSGGCRSVELPALAYVACALDERLRPLLPVSRAFLARLAKAERLVMRATRASRTHARRRLAGARKALLALKRTALRRGRVLGQTLLQAVVLETDVIASRIRAVRRTL